ncbi:hypothetical protein XHV734_0429 [Xanthomonas hortorum pv. vitians]|nr:hypothetical protein XHV734_0429 [Xanthomonas hortorum pv. vitians]
MCHGELQLVLIRGVVYYLDSRSVHPLSGPFDPPQGGSFLPPGYREIPP